MAITTRLLAIAMDWMAEEFDRGDIACGLFAIAKWHHVCGGSPRRSVEYVIDCLDAGVDPLKPLGG